jgi:CMP-N-acetylneuraminic acid synthetase
LNTINSEGFLQNIFDESSLSHNINLSTTNIFIPNGSIFIARTDPFLQSKDLYTGNCVAFLMEKEDSVDIDTIEDFNLAEVIFWSQKK